MLESDETEPQEALQVDKMLPASSFDTDKKLVTTSSLPP